MKINISSTPAQNASQYITELLREAKGNTLVLLSGGSAFEMLDMIDESALNQNQTFMMMDERFSDDPKVNNYLQFSQTNLFEKLKSRHVKIIESSFNTEKVSLKDAAIAMRKTLDYFFKVQKDCNVIALFGIGEDGHTASILPKTTEEEFNSVYRTNDLYIPVVEPSNPYPERMTITPYFIKNYVNEAIIFAIGDEKCQGVLKNIQEGSHTENELPALIPANHPNSTLFTDCENLE